jgi:hypothetical protein
MVANRTQPAAHRTEEGKPLCTITRLARLERFHRFGRRRAAAQAQWLSPVPTSGNRDYPPYAAWDGELPEDGSRRVLIAPSLLEYDVGTGLWTKALDVFEQIDDTPGRRQGSRSASSPVIGGETDHPRLDLTRPPGLRRVLIVEAAPLPSARSKGRIAILPRVGAVSTAAGGRCETAGWHRAGSVHRDAPSVSAPRMLRPRPTPPPARHYGHTTPNRHILRILISKGTANVCRGRQGISYEPNQYPCKQATKERTGRRCRRSDHSRGLDCPRRARHGGTAVQLHRLEGLDLRLERRMQREGNRDILSHNGYRGDEQHCTQPLLVCGVPPSHPSPSAHQWGRI